MKPVTFLALLGLALGLLGAATAGEPSWKWPWHCTRPHCPTCPDDYCPKRLPGACPIRCCGADDYCPKSLPSVRPVKCFLKDDYCPKGCSISIPHCYPPWYTCGGGCR